MSRNDRDIESEADEMENRPLINNQFGFNNGYGNIEDNSKSKDYDYEANKSTWIDRIPYVGDRDYSHNGKISRSDFTPKKVIKHLVLDPISYIPAVILGLLLNLLDAISYGKNLFQ